MLDLCWSEAAPEKLLAIAQREVQKVEKFVELAEEAGKSVLVVCSSGKNRALSLVALLLMRRYRWSFYKTLEFLDSKRPNLEINKAFFCYLKDAADDFEKQVSCTRVWGKYGAPKAFLEEEILITNTYINGLKDDKPEPASVTKGTLKVTWADKANAVQRPKSVKKKPSSEEAEKPANKLFKGPIDRKKLENFIRLRKREKEEQGSKDLFRQCFKDLQSKILCPQKSGNDDSAGSSSLSKVSTTILEDSLTQKQKKVEEKEKNPRTPRPSENEKGPGEAPQGSGHKRPSSAPSKQEQKEKMIQMYLFMDGKKKGNVLNGLLQSNIKSQTAKNFNPKDVIAKCTVEKGRLY